MTFDPAEHDDEGNWTGTCAECATNHDGYHPDTFGGRMRCLRAQAEAIGADHLIDQVDACQRQFDRRRDEILRLNDLIP